MANRESHEGNGEQPAAAQGVSGRGTGQWTLRATLWWLASLPSGDSLTNLQEKKGTRAPCTQRFGGRMFLRESSICELSGKSLDRWEVQGKSVCQGCPAQGSGGNQSRGWAPPFRALGAGEGQKQSHIMRYASVPKGSTPTPAAMCG